MASNPSLGGLDDVGMHRPRHSIMMVTMVIEVQVVTGVIMDRITILPRQ